MKRLVIDTETTGLSPEVHRTLTVGMLLIDVEHDFLDILDSSHILIRHDDWVIDPDALKINKIDLNEHIKAAVFPDIACAQINDFVDKNELDRTPLLGHNIAFDKEFLKGLFIQGKSVPKFHSTQIDTMHLWNDLKRKGQVPWNYRSNLPAVAKYFGIETINSHDALADCHTTAKVYQNLLKIM